ncbi:MAG: PAS domain S-box protein [Bacteroidales bacterium]
MSVFKIAPENMRTIPWKLVVIFLLFSAVIILAGDYYYKSQRNRIFIEQQNNLSAIATLKIGQITLWHKERLGDANVITGNEPLINRIKQYFGDENQPGIKREIIKWMESFYEENDYSGVSLVDTLLKIRLASSSSDPVTNEGITEELKEVIRNQKIIIKDLFRAGNNKQVQMDILVPLIDPGNKEPKIFGIVILRIDPGKFLFPLIQSWPTPSKSAETLLLRKDGDSVLYLNELRHQKNTALNLKLPVDHKNLLAAKVVNGFEGIAEGVDYRKIPVVGSLSKIRGMPWYMVAKIDEKEIQAPLKRFIYITGSAIVLLILIVVSVFGLLIWNQRLRFYKQQLNNELDRKKAEDALRDSENKFRQTFDLSPVGIVMVGLDKRFLRCNGAFSQSLGYLPEELVGKTFTDVTYPEDIRIGIDEMMAMIKGEIAISHVQKRYVRKDGQIVWGEVLISLIRDNKGHPQYFLTIVQDITERKLAEEALLESEDKFKYIFDHSLVGKSITLPSGEINVNRAFSEMLGYKPEELKKMNWADISYPADIELTNEALGLILSGEKDSVRFIKRYIHKNGSVVWADVGTSLRRDAEGKPLYFMTSTNDITERKHAEESLRESEKRLREAQEMAHLGFWFWDVKTGYVEWSDEVYKIFCLDPKKFTPQIDSILALSPWEEDNQRDKELINRAVNSHSPGSYEQKFLRPDKSIAHYYSTFQGNYNEKGDIISMVGTVLDITERKNAESQIKKLNEELERRVIVRTEQLEAANKELEAFSYSVSHDLRAPLRSVHGYTKILLEEYENKLDNEGKRICGIISSSATHMGELIDDLLSFSKIGRSSLNPSLIDMEKMVRNQFEGKISPNEKEKIKLYVGKLHKAFGDVTLLGQVWFNLLTNAIKYSSKNEISEISIGSSVSGKMITYFIKDNGVGFDMQYAHKLFGVFQRLHSEAEFEGNGVGLAIVQRIILKHGGRVWAEGAVGKGATFYFSLPVQDKRQK